MKNSAVTVLMVKPETQGKISEIASYVIRGGKVFAKLKGAEGLFSLTTSDTYGAFAHPEEEFDGFQLCETDKKGAYKHLTGKSFTKVGAQALVDTYWELGVTAPLFRNQWNEYI